MSLETEIRTLILADGAVAALIGDRLYPILLPTSATLEAISYNIISQIPVVGHDRDTGLDVCRVQLDCWGNTYAEAKALAAAVRSAISGTRSGNLDGIFLINQSDAREDQTGSYRVIQEYRVIYAV